MNDAEREALRQLAELEPGTYVTLWPGVPGHDYDALVAKGYAVAGSACIGWPPIRWFTTYVITEWGRTLVEVGA